MASAETDPLSLYTATEGVEANEFKRTSSRLIEMGSESYLALPHGRSDSSASGATTAWSRPDGVRFMFHLRPRRKPDAKALAGAAVVSTASSLSERRLERLPRKV